MTTHPIGLVDAHVHLTDFEDGTDIQSLISRAVDAGVSHLVCNGTSEDDWPEVLEVAEGSERVIPCFGVHPWFVNRRSQNWLSVLGKYISDTPSAVGEIGLDKNVENLDTTAQEETFRAQLEIARKYRRPAMIHCVKSWGWLMDVLRTEAPLPCGMLMHAYAGSVELIRELAQMGAYFSFSGKVLEPNYEKPRRALMAVPIDRLLIETDAPAMIPPEQYRLHRIYTSRETEHNSPANLPAIMNGVAELLGRDREYVIQLLAGNAREFLRPVIGVNE